MTIFEKLKFLKSFGYRSIAQVGGLKQAGELFTALKEMQKNKGMMLCEDCMKRKVGEKTDDSEAIKKAASMYKAAPPGGNCFLCANEAKYMISMGDAMEGIKKSSKGGSK